MERDDMIKRLESGEKAIDLSIEKLKDILAGTGINDGGDNCACCYLHDFCDSCHIRRYEDKYPVVQEDGSEYILCSDMPDETDKIGLEYAIEHLKKVKQWMIETGEYEKDTIVSRTNR